MNQFYQLKSCMPERNLATMGNAPYHPLALRTSLSPGRETPIRVFDWLSYTRKIWNAVRLQKALYAEMCAYKNVCIHFFCHATLNAKASLWLLLHTAHPACAQLTPNTERINHRTNCNIPYIWIFWSYTSRGYDRVRHAGKKMARRERSPLGTRLH